MSHLDPITQVEIVRNGSKEQVANAIHKGLIHHYDAVTEVTNSVHLYNEDSMFHLSKNPDIDDRTINHLSYWNQPEANDELYKHHGHKMKGNGTTLYNIASRCSSHTAEEMSKRKDLDGSTKIRLEYVHHRNPKVIANLSK